MLKEELRKSYLDKRKKLTPSECAHFNLKLDHLFFSSIDFLSIKIIHTYLPILKQNEPDTWKIIDRLQREFPHINISIPRVNTRGELESYYFEGPLQLHTNPWGIQEPKQGILTPQKEIDLVIVPLLVVDQHGHRVGYGKGFYDRFLKKCSNHCKTIGLSFFKPVPLISDTNENDVALTSAIEPSGVHYF